jgi:hypothetical protein
LEALQKKRCRAEGCAADEALPCSAAEASQQIHLLGCFCRAEAWSYVYVSSSAACVCARSMLQRMLLHKQDASSKKHPLQMSKTHPLPARSIKQEASGCLSRSILFSMLVQSILFSMLVRGCFCSMLVQRMLLQHACAEDASASGCSCILCRSMMKRILCRRMMKRMDAPASSAEEAQRLGALALQTKLCLVLQQTHPSSFFCRGCFCRAEAWSYYVYVRAS